MDVSNKSIASIEVWPNDIVRPFFDGTSTYVPGKKPTHFEHYAHCEERKRRSNLAVMGSGTKDLVILNSFQDLSFKGCHCEERKRRSNLTVMGSGTKDLVILNLFQDISFKGCHCEERKRRSNLVVPIPTGTKAPVMLSLTQHLSVAFRLKGRWIGLFREGDRCSFVAGYLRTGVF